MNPDQPREFQAPLMARARGDIDSPDVVCKVNTGRAWVDVSRRTT